MILTKLYIVHMAPDMLKLWYGIWIYWFSKICPYSSLSLSVGLFQDFRLILMSSRIHSRLCCFVRGSNRYHQADLWDASRFRQCYKNSRNGHVTKHLYIFSRKSLKNQFTYYFVIFSKKTFALASSKRFILLYFRVLLQKLVWTIYNVSVSLL